MTKVPSCYGYRPRDPVIYRWVIVPLCTLTMLSAAAFGALLFMKAF